jgi:transposase
LLGGLKWPQSSVGSIARNKGPFTPTRSTWSRFIEFLKRLIADAKRTIFLIVDRGPAHRAKKTKAFVETLGGKLRLFFLPPYSPDRNPDELVWKHLKADKVGRMAVSGKEDFKRKVRLSMRQLQNDPKKILSFYQKPSLQYAACM